MLGKTVGRESAELDRLDGEREGDVRDDPGRFCRPAAPPPHLSWGQAGAGPVEQGQSASGLCWGLGAGWTRGMMRGRAEGILSPRTQDERGRDRVSRRRERRVHRGWRGGRSPEALAGGGGRVWRWSPWRGEHGSPFKAERAWVGAAGRWNSLQTFGPKSRKWSERGPGCRVRHGLSRLPRVLLLWLLLPGDWLPCPLPPHLGVFPEPLVTACRHGVGFASISVSRWCLATLPCSTRPQGPACA